MNSQQIMRIFEDTAYIRMGGRPEEKKTAEVRAMIETFNTKVDFVDLSALEPIAEEINRGIE